MTFASPELLVGLLLVPAAIGLYLLVQRRRSRYAVRFTNVDLLANIAPKTPAWRRHVPPVLYLVAITALVIGLARPSMVMAVPRNEATIILTIDVSGSMQATDVQPTRLAAAQKAASDFVDQLPSSFRVGLVVFSTEARIELPPTTDHAQVHTAIDNLAAHGGTAMGDAIELSLEAAGVAGSGSGTGQGPTAPGGAVDYIVRGNMIGGFGLVAYPAEYGNSGIMTFIINNDGDIYEKDFGEVTARNASRITSFNPDHTWKKVVDTEK